MDAEAEVERPGALTSTNTVGSPRKLKKVRKKRAPAVSLDGRPETLHPEALDERLDQLLSKKHQELWQKLETWMRRQEELILSIDNKILWPGQSYGSLADLETVHEDVEPGIPDISEVAKKALKTQKTDATFSSTVSPSSGEGSAKMKMKAAVWNVSTKSKEPQKQKNRLRNSREVQDFYMQRRIMEMKKTRKNPMGPPETFRDRLTDIMTNAMFEMGMMCLCLLSAVVVGIEVNWFAQNLSASSPPLAFTIINHTISVIFAMELAMKVYVLRFRFFFVDVGWHLLDMLVVGTGLVELAIDLVGMVNTCPRDAFSSDCSESGVDLSILRALRVARAVRLARLARLVQYIRELRRLIISVAATLKSVFWTIVLLAMIIYTFAVIFQQAVNDHEQSLLQQNLSSQSDLEKFFPGLLRTAMTLLQTATGGVSWIEVESTISGISSLLVVLFLCYFSFIYFAVLNVVTGVFCSSAIESASQDAEAQIDEHVRKSKDYSERLKSLFTQIDTDGTGTIGILEFEEMWEDPGLQALLSTLGINQSKAWKLFEIMDEDNNGEINAEEFVSTCFKLQGSAQRVDTERIYAGLKRVGAAIEELGGVLTDILQTVGFLKNTFELRRPPQAAVPRSATSPLRKATTMT